METWVYFYAIGVCFVVHLGNLMRPAFDKNNMVPDPITYRSQYVVTDYKWRTKVVPLKVGVALSMYTVITSICMLVLGVMALFYAPHWWYGLLVVIGSSILQTIYCKVFKLSLFSILFFIELIASPFLIFFTNYYMCFSN